MEEGSPWKGSSNVKIRFRLWSDWDASTGNGWLIDDLSVTENPDASTALVLPFTEDFEDPLLPHWNAADWRVVADAIAKDGAQSLMMSDSDSMLASTHRWVELDQPVDLPEGSNVQATFWFRGKLTTRSYLSLQYSENEGVSWADLSGASVSYTIDRMDTWTRLQASLASLAGKRVRLRFDGRAYYRPCYPSTMCKSLRCG